MEVTLSPELEELIDTKVESGLYASPVEVIRQALHLLDEWDRSGMERHQELRQEIVRGVEELDRGEGAPLDVDAIKRKARQIRGRRSSATG